MLPDLLIQTTNLEQVNLLASGLWCILFESLTPQSNIQYIQWTLKNAQKNSSNFQNMTTAGQANSDRFLKYLKIQLSFRNLRIVKMIIVCSLVRFKGN